jgi:hypothetical protein
MTTSRPWMRGVWKSVEPVTDLRWGQRLFNAQQAEHAALGLQIAAPPATSGIYAGSLCRNVKMLSPDCLDVSSAVRNFRVV